MGKWITYTRSAQKHNRQNFKHNWRGLPAFHVWKILKKNMIPTNSSLAEVLTH